MRLSIFPYADIFFLLGIFPLPQGRPGPGRLRRGPLGSHQTGPPCLSHQSGPVPQPRSLAYGVVCKGIYPLSSLFCFIVAVGCYGPGQSSVETLAQHFRPGRLAKSITALPSGDGRQLPCPMAASTSPAFPGAARTTRPVLRSPAWGTEASPPAGGRPPPRSPESLRIKSLSFWALHKPPDGATSGNPMSGASGWPECRSQRLRADSSHNCLCVTVPRCQNLLEGLLFILPRGL